MTELLTELQLKRLSQHKYNAQSSTILDPMMQIYWRWLVEKCPLWLAPNTITFTGLVLNLATTLLLVYYCPQAKGEASALVYILLVIGLFIYQSLDAIDGKQARRTGSSSPLGELFDHGCDALSMMALSIACCISLELGYHPHWMLTVCVMSMVMYYCAHWQSYVSGVLRFGRFDVTEVQFLAMMLFILTAIFGVTFWSVLIPVINVEMRWVAIFGAVVGCVYNLFTVYAQISQGGVGKNGSTVAGTSVLSPAVPFLIFISLELYVYVNSTGYLFQRHPVLFCFAFGLGLCKLAMKLVVACLTKSAVDRFNVAMIMPLIQCINIHYSSPLSEYYLLAASLVIAFVDVMKYCVVLINQISLYLGVSCFTIPPPKKLNSTEYNKIE